MSECADKGKRPEAPLTQAAPGIPLMRGVAGPLDVTLTRPWKEGNP